MTRQLSALLVIVLAALLAADALAQTPAGTAFTYQGLLKKDGPVTDTCAMRFRLYAQETGGSPLGEVNQAVVVTEGLFTAALDFGATPFTCPEARWLGVEVQCDGDPGFVLLSPRQQLTPTPFSLNTRGICVDAGNNVGIGTSVTDARLRVSGGDIRVDHGASLTSAGTMHIQTSQGSALRLNPFSGGGPVIVGGFNPGATSELNISSGGGQPRLVMGASELIDTLDGALRIRSGGNVIALDGNDTLAIGTTTPNTEYKIDIVDPARALIQMTAPESGLSIGDPTGLKWALHRRVDVGGVNNDLKLLRYLNGSYAGISLQVENTTGNIGIGMNDIPDGAKQARVSVRAPDNQLMLLDSGGSSNPAPPHAAAIAFNNDTSVGLPAGGSITFQRRGLDGFPEANLLSINVANGYVGFLGNINPDQPIRCGTAYCDGMQWLPSSDRNLKRDLRLIDAHEVLQKVAALPIGAWNYTTEDDSVEHIGPMAQDFFEAFGLGSDDTVIGPIDSGGVALAAIQGLHRIVTEKDTEIAGLKTRQAGVEAQLAALEALVARLAAEKEGHR